MKFFACLFALVAVASIALADNKPIDRKDGLLGSSYGGGASYSAPPCPKSYLFSCQPSMAPVPCAASGGSGGGYSGAYSQYVPQYALPQQYAPRQWQQYAQQY